VPELPDIVVYLAALAPRVLHQRLERLRIANPFLVRTPEPPVSAAEGRRVVSLRGERRFPAGSGWRRSISRQAARY
jgi:formamidopyrimidine-DNA glycosylase